MRDPKRIHGICVLLENVWKFVPDWRIGQLICNVGRVDGHFDPFYIEDDRVKEILEGWLQDSEHENKDENHEEGNEVESPKDDQSCLTQMRDALETIVDLTIDYDGEITSEGLMRLIDQIRYVAKQNLQETGG